MTRLRVFRDSLWPQVLPQSVDNSKTASAGIAPASMHAYECLAVCLHDTSHKSCSLIAVGSDGKPVRSKYDPFHALLQSLQADTVWSEEGPALDPLAAALQDGKQPWQSIKSKYDPIQALFNAEDPTGSSPGPLDPLGSLAQQARRPASTPSQAFKTQLDPFSVLFAAPGPSSGTSTLDPLGNLLQSMQCQRPASAQSKYNPFQALFTADGPSAETSPLDPLGNLLQAVRLPHQASAGKYDPIRELYTAEGPNAATAALDPLGHLLQAVRLPRQASVDSKYDPFQALFRLQGPSARPAALDPLQAVLRDGKEPWRAVKSKYDPVQAVFNAQQATGEQ